MTAIISYGPTVSREGMKHAQRKTSGNLYRSASGSNLSARRSNDRASVPELTAEQMELEDERIYVHRHGEPTRMKDGSVVWIIPKRVKKAERPEECDRWAAKKTTKATKIPNRKTGGAKGYGNADTNDKSVQVGKNPYDLGLRAPALAIDLQTATKPKRIDWDNPKHLSEWRKNMDAFLAEHPEYLQ